ncbi:hypothetical protein CLF_104214 [Clonorchis sinensis]|uniref:Uncharacterized protein n=1 Tax=Clonorchis sinensis TaxID=79923 RepID=G7YB61_CLOSI|nr:hypothetical protein CLF_104214 [Clonorchis sinensis]
MVFLEPNDFMDDMEWKLPSASYFVSFCCHLRYQTVINSCSSKSMDRICFTFNSQSIPVSEHTLKLLASFAERVGVRFFLDLPVLFTLQLMLTCNLYAHGLRTNCKRLIDMSLIMYDHDYVMCAYSRRIGYAGRRWNILVSALIDRMTPVHTRFLLRCPGLAERLQNADPMWIKLAQKMAVFTDKFMILAILKYQVPEPASAVLLQSALVCLFYSRFRKDLLWPSLHDVDFYTELTQCLHNIIMDPSEPASRFLAIRVYDALLEKVAAADNIIGGLRDFILTNPWNGIVLEQLQFVAPQDELSYPSIFLLQFVTALSRANNLGLISNIEKVSLREKLRMEAAVGQLTSPMDVFLTQQFARLFPCQVSDFRMVYSRIAEFRTARYLTTV